MCGGTGGCGGGGSGCGGSAAVMAAGSDAAAADYAWLYDEEGGAPAPEPTAAVSQPRLELEVSWGGFVALAVLVALLVALPGLIRSMR